MSEPEIEPGTVAQDPVERRRPVGAPALANEESSGRRILILIAAICLGFAGVWTYIFLNQKPPVAAGVITQLAAVPIHTELRQGGTMQEGRGGGVDVEDQVLVLVNATVKNTSRIPIFPFEQTGTLTLPTGEQKRARALSTVDMMRAFRAYPALAAAHAPVLGPSLHREVSLQPGEAEHGLVLFSFPIKQEDWESRRSFDLELSIRWQQRNLVVPEPASPLPR